MDVLIVDGYNVINAWPELCQLKEESLEHARERLIQWMASFAGFKGMAVTVVFDAYLVKGGQERCYEVSGIQVVFSQDGETADSVIEKLVYTLVKDRRQKVFVATSDWAEQLTILGSGAYRMPVRELRNAVTDATKQQMAEHGDRTGRQRQTLESRLENDVIMRLEEIRRRKLIQWPEKRQLD
jgi:uncharacterized protein